MNTRMAYLRAVSKFFAWADEKRLRLEQIRPLHVAAYVEALARDVSAPTVKQNLAAIRMLFGYLVVSQIIEMNPAAAVRGPRYSAKKGKTPVLDADEAILGKIGPDLSALARPAFDASRSIAAMFDPMLIDKSVALFAAQTAKAARLEAAIFDPMLIDKSVALFAAQTAKAAQLGVGLESVNKAIFATDWLRQFKQSSIEQNASLTVQAHLARLYERSAFAENTLARVRGESIGTKLAVEQAERLALRTSHDTFGNEYREFFGHVRGSDIGVLEVPSSLTELPAEEFVNQSALVVSTSESEVDEESAEAEREVTNEYTAETSDSLTTLISVFNPELVHLLNGAREAFNSRHTDYVRHFVTSYRELFTHLLHALAPDEQVRAWTKDPSHFSNNRPTRRARLLYITRELGPLFGGFMSADVETVLEFINVFQKGTHGIRPQFTDEQLLVMKTRTEGLLRFMLTVYQVTTAV